MKGLTARMGCRRFRQIYAYWLIIWGYLAGFALSTPVVASEATTVVSYVDASSIKRNPNNVYFIEVLKLALEKSSVRYGEFALNPIDIDISQNRQIRELNKGRISVFWTMTSYAREVDMLPVRFPLAKGMYGIRLFAINQSDQQRFVALKSREQLAAWPALLGRDWPDTAIMRVNRFLVRSDVDEGDMYKELAQHKGYYFPRAVTEIYSEIDERPKSDVIADDHLGVVYPAAIYFFVSKNNPLLAERLQFGLEEAHKDGSFDALFFGFPAHQAAFAKAKFSKRTLFYLDNPLLPQAANRELIEAMQKDIIEKFAD
ncbi:transporter substrate-binding domain-containing protein [Shewanella acanthi]|uniref:transporter substrate-binding domain-containing protein n=1 Tax=Shewanella acanthi TaxID=2864212 RepID=UPI001C659101|nr:transporter substrate-binding domain-containing protein [Shewanella acanthi]QYJ79221.1 transporter substrate-binding domain-containing protein [Shewanella acanthi]